MRIEHDSNTTMCHALTLHPRSLPSYNTAPCEVPRPFSIRPSRRFPVCP
jgi:hypothetical protein